MPKIRTWREVNIRKCRTKADLAMRIIELHRPNERLDRDDAIKLYPLLSIFEGLAKANNLRLPEQRFKPLEIFPPEIFITINEQCVAKLAEGKVRIEDRSFVNAHILLDKMATGIVIEPEQMEAYPALIVLTSALMEVGL